MQRDDGSCSLAIYFEEQVSVTSLTKGAIPLLGQSGRLAAVKDEGIPLGIF